jgi:hypothetical protein
MPPSCRVNVPMKTNIRIIITQSRNTPGAAEVVINTCIVPLRRRSSAASSDHPRGSLPGRQHAPSSHSNVAPARTWLAFHAWAQGTAKKFSVGHVHRETQAPGIRWTIFFRPGWPVPGAIECCSWSAACSYWRASLRMYRTTKSTTR